MLNLSHVIKTEYSKENDIFLIINPTELQFIDA